MRNPDRVSTRLPSPNGALQARGFTLVEVLVAVAIVAMAVTAVLVAMMRQVDGSVYLRDKLVAEWVALNQAELTLLANRHSNQLPPEKRSGSEEMAGRTWYWQAQRQRAQADGFTQLEISVSSEEDSKAAPLASIALVLDQFHRLQ